MPFENQEPAKLMKVAHGMLVVISTGLSASLRDRRPHRGLVAKEEVVSLKILSSGFLPARHVSEVTGISQRTCTRRFICSDALRQSLKAK